MYFLPHRYDDLRTDCFRFAVGTDILAYVYTDQTSSSHGDVTRGTFENGSFSIGRPGVYFGEISTRFNLRF